MCSYQSVTLDSATVPSIRTSSALLGCQPFHVPTACALHLSLAFVTRPSHDSKLQSNTDASIMESQRATYEIPSLSAGSFVHCNTYSVTFRNQRIICWWEQERDPGLQITGSVFVVEDQVKHTRPRRREERPEDAGGVPVRDKRSNLKRRRTWRLARVRRPACCGCSVCISPPHRPTNYSTSTTMPTAVADNSAGTV